MKEPDYVMKIVATGGTLISDESFKQVTRKWTDGDGAPKQANFQYTKPFDWHFCHHHIVDE